MMATTLEVVPKCICTIGMPLMIAMLEEEKVLMEMGYAVILVDGPMMAEKETLKTTDTQIKGARAPSHLLKITTIRLGISGVDQGQLWPINTVWLESLALERSVALSNVWI